MTQGKKIFQPLTSESICEIYRLLYNEGLISFPITSEAGNKIDALVANLNGTSFGVPHYPTIKQKVVAYFYFLINNHAFTDGNKRTATLSLLVLCRINDLKINLLYNLDALAVFLEELEEDDHQQLIDVLSRGIFID